MTESILARIAKSYDGLYGQTIHGDAQSTCLASDCPTCIELLRLKREGLISEFACWGISTYSITPKGRKESYR